jgi:hypothetical protein
MLASCSTSLVAEIKAKYSLSVELQRSQQRACAAVWPLDARKALTTLTLLTLTRLSQTRFDSIMILAFPCLFHSCSIMDGRLYLRRRNFCSISAFSFPRQF